MVAFDLSGCSSEDDISANPNKPFSSGKKYIFIFKILQSSNGFEDLHNALQLLIIRFKRIYFSGVSSIINYPRLF